MRIDHLFEGNRLAAIAQVVGNTRKFGRTGRLRALRVGLAKAGRRRRRRRSRNDAIPRRTIAISNQRRPRTRSGRASAAWSLARARLTGRSEISQRSVGVRRHSRRMGRRRRWPGWRRRWNCGCRRGGSGGRRGRRRWAGLGRQCRNRRRVRRFQDRWNRRRRNRRWSRLSNFDDSGRLRFLNGCGWRCACVARLRP